MEIKQVFALFNLIVGTLVCAISLQRALHSPDKVAFFWRLFVGIVTAGIAFAYGRYAIGTGELPIHPGIVAVLLIFLGVYMSRAGVD